MSLGISKLDFVSSNRAVTPLAGRRPLHAVLDEIEALRLRPEIDGELAGELDSLERSVRKILGHINVAAAHAEREALSRRELHVLTQLGVGMSNKQIARRLAISEKTVRNHLTKVFDKLDATNRTEAVVIAMREGLISG